MPNQPNPNNVLIAIRVRRELKRKIDIMAETFHKESVDVVRNILEDATQNIVLSPEDYIKIAEEVRRARS